MNDNEIIDKFIEYQVNFVEKKCAWNSFPICPYAEEFRVKGKILYHVKRFSLDNCLEPEILDPIKEFAKQNYYLAMLFINPEATIDFQTLEEIVGKMYTKLRDLQVEIFSGHPKHELNVKGVYLRREPFVTLQFMQSPVLSKFAKKLMKTEYYKDWEDNSLKYIQFDKYLED